MILTLAKESVQKFIPDSDALDLEKQHAISVLLQLVPSAHRTAPNKEYLRCLKECARKFNQRESKEHLRLHRQKQITKKILHT